MSARWGCEGCPDKAKCAVNGCAAVRGVSIDALIDALRADVYSAPIPPVYCGKQHPSENVRCTRLHMHDQDAHHSEDAGIFWLSERGLAPTAVVLVTLAVGRVRWTRELCTVRRVLLAHVRLSVEVQSVCDPSQVATVPINNRSVELVAPALPDHAGGEHVVQ